MSDKTGIEWTDATWNPVTGCTKVSPGCDNCYAETFAERWRGTPGHYFENGFDVQLRPDKLELPLRWKRPRRIFVNSMSDLFHDDVPGSYIGRVWDVMAQCPQHTFQILTKRHARMKSVVGTFTWDRAPLPNVWLGVSAENQQWADIRIPALLDTPAAVRFVSAEPLLGPIDICESLALWKPPMDHPAWGGKRLPAREVLHWLIAGGESGRGARPMNPDWVRQLRDDCERGGIAFLFKQWGGRTPKANGRELDGRTWDEYPQAVTV